MTAALTAAEFGELSRDLLAQPDEQSTMQRIVDRAVLTVPAAVYASLMFGTATAMSQKRVAPFNIARTTIPVHRRPISSIA